MTRTYLSLIAFFLLAVLPGRAQDEPERSKEITVTKSNPYPVIDAAYKSYYSLGDNRVLAIKKIGKKVGMFSFQVFSGQELNQESATTEDITEPGLNIDFTSQFDGKIYMFYHVFTKGGTYQLFARKINTEKGGFDGSATSLLTVTDEKNKSLSFSVHISTNEKLFVVKYRKSPESTDDSKNNDIMGLYVFDSDLSAVSGGEYTMPYTEALMDNLNFTVDSKGTAYFLIRKYREEVKRKNSSDPENQSMAVLYTDGNSLKEVEFSLKDKIPTSYIFCENNTGNVMCTGYYKRPHDNGTEGAYVAIMNSDHEFTEPKFYEFPKEFITMYHNISDRRQKKIDKKDEQDELSLYNLETRRARVLEDGGLILAGEIYYYTTTTDSKGYTRYTYHYDDVIAIKIDKDGELEWMKKFPKRSTSESFEVMTSDKYSYVIFTDNPNNGQIPIDQSPTAVSAKNRFVIAYRINNDSGQTDYLPLFGYKQIDGINVYQYRLDRLIGLTENKFAVEMYIKGKKDMMFQVEFQE